MANLILVSPNTFSTSDGYRCKFVREINTFVSLQERKKLKNIFNEVKNKKFVLHSVNVFEALFPGSYKGWQITQKLTCVNVLLASSVLNVNYKQETFLKKRDAGTS